MRPTHDNLSCVGRVQIDCTKYLADIVQIEQDSKYLRNLDGLPLLVSRVKQNCQVVYNQLMDAMQRPAA